MEINVRNVANIKECKLTLKKDKLNVFYGNNGTGKSSIVSAIAAINNKEELDKYKPYDNPDAIPDISISGGKVSKIAVFNQAYVDQALFKESLIDNSYEVLIKDEEYDKLKYDVEGYLDKLPMILHSPEMKELKTKLEGFLETIKFNKRDRKNQIHLSKNSVFMKGRNSQKIVRNIDEDIKMFQEDIVGTHNQEWHDWMSKGLTISNEQDLCPYCKRELEEGFHDKVKKIINKFTKSDLTNNVKLKTNMQNITPILRKKHAHKLHDIILKDDELMPGEAQFIYDTYQTIHTELYKLDHLINLDTFQIKSKYEKQELVQFLNDNKLNDSLYKRTDKKLKEQIIQINQEIENVIVKVSELEDKTKELSTYIASLIDGKTSYVNHFLNLAGIPYSFHIEEKGTDQYVSYLRPDHSHLKINNYHLSYGERNAISVILFSLTIKDDHDLIILDDPISSFDKNKKYAILYYLFEASHAKLKGKTVMLLTHDFEVVVDCLHKTNFSRLKPKCYYLYNNQNTIEQVSIDQKSIIKTINKWKNNILKEKNPIAVKIVNLRKYIEYEKGTNSDSYHMISSLEHIKKYPQYYKNKSFIDFTDEQFKLSTQEIQAIVPDFNYQTWYQDINNVHTNIEDYMNTHIDIEKLQILRIIYMLIEKEYQLLNENKVFADFVTETYHIENNEMMSFSKESIKTIPQYILKMADALVEEVKQNIN